MCLSCGCGEPNDNHGEPRHITLDMLAQAAEAAECSPEEAANKIITTLQQTTINLNTASAESLDSLPGLGPVGAKAIVDYRERNGPFTSVEDITKVSGIGPTTYEQIRHLITVGGRP